MLMWKIVERVEASVIYIYIYRLVANPGRAMHWIVK